MQIGANDGITHDPIHKFIKRDGWNGILLEPQKYVYDKFLSRLYKNQNGIETMHAALGYQDGVAPLYKIGFCDDRWATGLASFDKSTVVQAFTSGHVERQCRKRGIQIPHQSKEQIVVEEVPVISVGTLLSKFAVSEIDLLQIDTEGFDYEIIKMFDLSIVPICAISFEHMHLSETDRIECESYLTNHGFVLSHFGGNTLAQRSSSLGHT